MSEELIASAAGRDWAFKLTIGQWMKLQSAFGKIGPARISERMSGEDWTIEDLREVIERGLEGGGIAPGDARTAATEIVDSMPLLKAYELVSDVLGCAFAGLEELAKKKATAAQMAAALSRISTGNGSSTSSSRPAS